ncbi:MAG: hypothetical protein ABI370_08560 [Gammaproteobacteria bacterium]
MHRSQANDLFQLQTELVDMKVEMAVSKSIDRVVEQITNLRYEMHTDFHGIRHEMTTEFHGLKHEMSEQFSALDNRVIASETKLGMVAGTRKAWYDRIMDQVVKSVPAGIGFLVAYLILHFK